jgi:hypothetical protein
VRPGAFLTSDDAAGNESLRKNLKQSSLSPLAGPCRVWAFAGMAATRASCELELHVTDIGKGSGGGGA